MDENEQILVRHHRFVLLDAVRGVAAIFVAALHTPPSMQRFLPFPNSFLAVDLFFCLSGFVIAFAYEERLRRGLTFGKFMLARVIRLYPLYLLGLCLGAFAIIGRSHYLPTGERLGGTVVVSFGLGLLMLPSLLKHTLTTNAFPFNPPSWSLCFEMLVNLLYAALVLWHKASVRVIAGLALISLIATCAAVFLNGADLASGWAADRSFLLGVPRVGFSFFTGVLLFRLFQARPALRLPAKLHSAMGLVVVLCTAAVLGAPFRWMGTASFQAACIFLLIPLLIYMGACVPVGTRWRGACLVLGEISYPLYVLHLPLFSPLYLLQKLRFAGWLYQALAPVSVIVLAAMARWIALHYDAPVRRQIERRFALKSS